MRRTCLCFDESFKCVSVVVYYNATTLNATNLCATIYLMILHKMQILLYRCLNRPTRQMYFYKYNLLVRSAPSFFLITNVLQNY